MKKWIIKIGTEYFDSVLSNPNVLDNVLITVAPLVAKWFDRYYEANNVITNVLKPMAGNGRISANIKLIEIDDDNYESLVRLTEAYHLETFLSRSKENITNKAVKKYLERYLSKLQNNSTVIK